MSLQEKLLCYRAKHNLSQNDMVELLGVASYNTYRKIENGEHTKPITVVKVEERMKEIEDS